MQIGGSLPRHWLRDWHSASPRLKTATLPAALLQVQSYKRKIKELEDKLLSCLVNSGNLLEDKELIDILAKTKETAQVGCIARDPGPDVIGQAFHIHHLACIAGWACCKAMLQQAVGAAAKTTCELT